MKGGGNDEAAAAGTVRVRSLRGPLRGRLCIARPFRPVSHHRGHGSGQNHPVRRHFLCAVWGNQRENRKTAACAAISPRRKPARRSRSPSPTGGRSIPLPAGPNRAVPKTGGRADPSGGGGGALPAGRADRIQDHRGHRRNHRPAAVRLHPIQTALYARAGGIPPSAAGRQQIEREILRRIFGTGILQRFQLELLELARQKGSEVLAARTHVGDNCRRILAEEGSPLAEASEAAAHEDGFYAAWDLCALLERQNRMDAACLAEQERELRQLDEEQRRTADALGRAREMEEKEGSSPPGNRTWPSCGRTRRRWRGASRKLA